MLNFAAAIKLMLIFVCSLAVLGVFFVLACELSDPILAHTLLDLQFGSSQSLESRISQWNCILAKQEKNYSSEFLADSMNALGFTYVDEFRRDGRDLNRLLLARWCCERSVNYAQLTQPSEKHSQQIKFANSMLLGLSKEIRKNQREKSNQKF
ncbi:MAG: hypothetical protein Q8T09_03905 [Candidatus Melainabacteria bacterium]|nr:hypothetical protein [Candidatus Melainabacteria bacterium]